MKESRLQRRIRQAVEKSFGGYWWKVHGGPFTPAGIPDLAGVVGGRAVFLEVKRPGEDASAVQQSRMRELKRAGALVAVVRSPEDATYFIEGALRGLKQCPHCHRMISPETVVPPNHNTMYQCGLCRKYYSPSRWP